MNKNVELEAAVFRRLLAHLDSRKDVQNIDQDDGDHGGAGGADSMHDCRQNVETGSEGEPEENQTDIAARQGQDLVPGAHEPGHVCAEGNSEE